MTSYEASAANATTLQRSAGSFSDLVEQRRRYLFRLIRLLHLDPLRLAPMLGQLKAALEACFEAEDRLASCADPYATGRHRDSHRAVLADVLDRIERLAGNPGLLDPSQITHVFDEYLVHHIVWDTMHDS